MILLALLMAQAAPAACPATPAPTPPGWAVMAPVKAGATAGTAAPLRVGSGARATLLPVGSVTLPAATAKPAVAGSSSGVFAFRVPAGGRYRVSLGAGVWVDVVADGVALRSAAHAHGPACSPIRKMVDYDLRPGRYLLQIVGGAVPTLALSITPAP